MLDPRQERQDENDEVTDSFDDVCVELGDKRAPIMKLNSNTQAKTVGFEDQKQEVVSV